jgi:Fic family protein
MSSLETPPKNDAAIPSIDLRKADAAYKPFPPFAEWLSKSVLDTSRWDRYTEELKKRRESSPDLLPRALEIVKRAAAVDTGAIEGLYETDRGFTFTVAMEAAYWEAALEGKGPKVKALFESQLQAYDFVLDFATQQVPIAEAWIRKLHAEICQSQETYSVWTEIGPQEQPLPKGEYKHLPNHVMRADEKIHSYAPVDMTPSEMYRLCEELRSEAFLAAHTVAQASYAHYALAVIHPFADGNGRVARALASVFTYRSQSIPLLILVDNRKEYYAALESADNGDYQRFVDFILERAIDAVRLANESLRAAKFPSIDDALASIKRLYVTKGGYSHAEVDQAGFRFLELFNKEANQQIQKVSVKDILNAGVGFGNNAQGPTNPKYRRPITQGNQWMQISLSTVAPAATQVTRDFILELPKDCDSNDDLIIHDLNTNEVFGSHIIELTPMPTAALQMRISIEIERILREMIDELSKKAAAVLKS